MGLCTVSSLLLLSKNKRKKKKRVENCISSLDCTATDWEKSGRRKKTFTFTHNIQKPQTMKDTDTYKYKYINIYISLCRPINYLSVNFILQYCLRYYFK